MSTAPTEPNPPPAAGGTNPAPAAGAAPASSQPRPAPAGPPAPGPAADERSQRGLIVGVGLVTVLILAGLIAASIYLVNNPAQAATVRDVFIIFMALEAMVIGVTLVILIVQVAALTNVLKNEIKPILEATQETVNTVRGTTLFVSENLTEPLMKLNSYVAGLSKIVETLSALGNFFRRP